MPRQNRVTPFGDILATPDRGTFMGNRGVLHDDEGRILRAWQLKRWIDGVFVRRANSGEDAYLVWNDGLLAWSPGGYTRRMDRPKEAEVLVLTPESTVAAIRGGYLPGVHLSAAVLREGRG